MLSRIFIFTEVLKSWSSWTEFGNSFWKLFLFFTVFVSNQDTKPGNPVHDHGWKTTNTRCKRKEMDGLKCREEIVGKKKKSVALFSAKLFWFSFWNCGCLSFLDTTELFISSSKRQSRSLLCVMQDGYLRK